MTIKFFDLAKKVSKLSNHPDHQVGAVVTYKNRVVSIGANSMKTHPKSNHPHQRIHAELQAILNTDVRGCNIYVYRELKNGTRAISKPCVYCQSLLVQAGICNVYYINRQGSYCSEPTDGRTRHNKPSLVS